MKVRDSLLANPVVVRLLLRDDESENRTHDSIQRIQYGFKASRDRKKCSPGSGIPRIIQVSWSRVAYQIPSQKPNANNRIPGRVLSPQSSLKKGYPEWIFWRSLRCKYISRITGRLFAFISSSLEGSHKQYMESGVHWIQQRGNWILFHWSQSRAAAVPLSRLHFRSLGVWNILLSLSTYPSLCDYPTGWGYCWLNYNVAILLLPSDDVRCPIFPLYRRGFHQQKREGGSTWWW